MIHEMQHSTCSRAHKNGTNKQQPEPLYPANQVTISDQPSIETAEASKYTVALPLTNPETTKTNPASHTTGTRTTTTLLQDPQEHQTYS